jgi:hypothetical protein
VGQIWGQDWPDEQILAWIAADKNILNINKLHCNQWTLLGLDRRPRTMVNILAHNHPSGVAEPSRADELLTANLKRALALVEISVLDHFVVGTDSTLSFVERGLL